MPWKREPFTFWLSMLPIRHPRLSKPLFVLLLVALFPLCLGIGWTMVKYPRWADAKPGSDAAAWTAGVVCWAGVIVVVTCLGLWMRRRDRREDASTD